MYKINANIHADPKLIQLANKAINSDVDAYKCAKAFDLVNTDLINWESREDAESYLEDVYNNDKKPTEENVKNAPNNYLWLLVYNGINEKIEEPNHPHPIIRKEFETRISNGLITLQDLFCDRGMFYGDRLPGHGFVSFNNYISETIAPLFLELDTKTWSEYKTSCDKAWYSKTFIPFIQKLRRREAAKKAKETRKNNTKNGVSKNKAKKQNDSLYQAIINNDRSRVRRHELSKVTEKRFNLVKDAWLDEKTDSRILAYMLRTPQELHKPYVTDILNKLAETCYVHVPVIHYKIDKNIFEALTVPAQLFVLSRSIPMNRGVNVFDLDNVTLEDIESILVAANMQGLTTLDNYDRVLEYHSLRKIRLLATLSDRAFEDNRSNTSRIQSIENYFNQYVKHDLTDDEKVFIIMLHSVDVGNGNMNKLFNCLMTLKDEKVRNNLAKLAYLTNAIDYDMENMPEDSELVRLMELEKLYGNL